MADEAPRYLLGGGELLANDVPRVRSAGGEKSHPYSFAEAISRLEPQGRRAASQIAQLPSDATPDGKAVIGVTLHPSYLAKSYYPKTLVHELRLRHVGSRAVHIRPEKLTTKKSQDDPRPLPAPLIYLAGSAGDIQSFVDELADWRPSAEAKNDFRKIESLGLPGRDRLKGDGFSPAKTVPIEIVLHAEPTEAHRLERAFVEFARERGVEVLTAKSKQIGGLRFLAAVAPGAALERLLDFTFVRALRAMPRLAPFDPPMRSQVQGFQLPLPDVDAAAPDLAVAIFDGGLPANHGLDRWVRLQDAPGVGGPLSDGLTHGLAVTSAFLFGPIDEDDGLSTPPASVDHWRVIGNDTQDDDFELIPVLERIENIISSRPYDLINISLGPCIAIDDDDVTRWTSTLDVHLADGDTVATVACGNNGGLDQATGLHRIQPPSDGVNMLAIGACNSPNAKWKRAPYSAWGPGRSPGFVKPDIVAFGGSTAHPFLVLEDTDGAVGGTCGTSFAAPLVLRSAASIRAQFSDHLWAPALKALLVHHADPGSHPREEVGWGRLSHSLGDLVLCGDGEAHVVYQRDMPMTGSVRLFIPVPAGLGGRVRLKATFCFYTDVDPEDTLNYTRGGLEIAFRPDLNNIDPPYMKDGRLITPTVPKTAGFFSSSDLYAPEFIRRDDAHKWESTFTKTKTMNAASFSSPVFDVSYSARSHGQATSERPAHLKFALIATISQPGTADLYNRVVAASAGRLQPMRARANATVPIRLG